MQTPEIKHMFWIGLHIDGSLAKWAKVTRQKKRICIELLRTIPLSEGEMFSFPQSSIEEFPYEIVSGLYTSEVLLRQTQIQIQDKKKLLQSLPFQLEELLPCKLEEALVSAQISQGDTNKSSKVLFYATKDATLKQHVDFLKQKNAEPDEVSCTPAALWRFTQYFFPKLSETLCLHVGAKTSSLIGIIKDRPAFSLSFSLGSELFTEAFEKTPSDNLCIDLLDVCDKNHPELYRTTESAKKELDRAFTFFLENKKNTWENLVITGNFSTLPSLKSLIKSHLPDSIQIHECVEGEAYDATTLETYAIPIGLALDRISQDGLSTQFRQEKLPSPSTKNKRVKIFTSFALSCFVLTSTALLTSNMYLSHKKTDLLDSFYSSFAAQTKKPKTIEELEENIHSLEASLKKDKVPYPLALPPPNVSEVLAWISSHPILSSSSKESTPNEVDIKKLQYQLVKYPKPSAKSIPYTAKLNIEIDIPDKQVAKEFYDSLLKKNSFVDSKKDLSWQLKGSTYFISFFLKPQTGEAP